MCAQLAGPARRAVPRTQRAFHEPRPARPAVSREVRDLDEAEGVVQPVRVGEPAQGLQPHGRVAGGLCGGEHRFDERWSVEQRVRYYRNEVDDRTIFPELLQADQRTVTRSLYESFGEVDGVTVFHAGTGLSQDGWWTAQGGRVLTVTAVGEDLRQAIDRAYEGVARIHWPEGVYRTDIGWRALARD